MNDNSGKLTICERDYWVYQKKRTFFPWAIKMTKRYEKGKRRTLFVEFDFTVNLGTIPNATHSVHIDSVHYDTVDGYVHFLRTVLREYAEFTSEDSEQLFSAILNALMD